MDIDATSKGKIPCGNKPERYPRTNYKKYAQSSLWDNFGPDKKPKPELLDPLDPSNKPCSHIGCNRHVSHPCEHCGRQWMPMDSHQSSP
jgi:hypothetical protein